MLNCKRCGASFFFHRKVKLKDAEICGKCFKDLGFGKDYYLISHLYPYDDIKDGYKEYLKRKQIRELREALAADPPVRVVGLDKDLICTEEERSIFECVRDYLLEHDIDDSSLELVRRADAYLTIRFRDWDLARYKYTVRAKWMTFPAIESRNDHHAINDPELLSPELEDLLDDAISFIQDRTKE